MLRNHLKLAWKVLLRRPFFTAVSLFAVSFTLAVLLVGTSLFDHAFAAGAPEVRSDRTLGVYGVRFSGDHNTSSGNPGFAFLDRYVRTLNDVEEISIFRQRRPVAVYRDEQRLDMFLKATDGPYWRILDFDFLEGAAFSDGDDESGANVVVISRQSRERIFDGEPALGKELTADGQTLRVVGVVEDVSFARMAGFADLWVPIGSAKSQSFRSELRGGFSALILAHDVSDFPRIKRDYQLALQSVEFPDDRYHTVAGGADTLFEHFARTMLSSDYKSSKTWTLRAFLLLIGLLFVLLPTVNLVNLNVSRILERSSEIGVRKAFGASSASLVVQFVLENVVLTLLGALLALALSAGALSVIEARGVIPHAELGLNWRVFGAGFAMALAFGLLSGAWPAWKMSRLHPVVALRGGAA